MPMRTVTHVVVATSMKSMNTVIPTRTATHVVAATIMTTLIPTGTTFPVIPLTASAKFAIRMKNTAMFAAKA